MYYLNTSTTASKTWVQVDYDNAFTPSRNNNTYEPKYKARKNNPSFVVGCTESIAFDIDIVDSQALQNYFKTNEDNFNVETEVLRVWKTGSTPFDAKMAKFNMNLNPFDGEAGAPMRATGTLNMTDDGWTKGTVTFSGTTPTFTPAS